VVVPCPVLVGRSYELEVLVDALDAARTGRGGGVFVAGEAGIGKSRLVQEAISIATGRGMRVLRGRAVPGSAAAAFRPLSEALTAVAPEVASAANLTPWLPALAAIVPTVTSASPVDVTAPVRGEAVLRLLAEVCGANGGVIVLEDLHWADPETVAIVEHLSDHLDRVPVLCVVTLRSEERSVARDLLHRVVTRRTSPVLQLERLNEAQVAAMVFSCAGAAAPEVVERVVSLGEGVPFLIEEMLVSPGLPATFAEGVQGRLAEIGEQDRRVLVTAAAFGRHFDWRVLSAATGLDDAAVVGALDRGVAAQLLAVQGEGFRFRHALTAEAVFQSVTPPHREKIAGAAFEALDRAEPDPSVDAREVAARLAERAGHADRAGRLYAGLGDDALARGALQTATAALRRATELLPVGDERDRAARRLVDALVLAGHVDDALAVGDDLITRVPDDRAAAVQVRLAAAAATAARWAEARARLDEAHRMAGTSPSPELAADLAVRRAEVALATDDPGRAEVQARQALDLARAAGLTERECEALQLLGRCARRSSLDAAEPWFREALAVAERSESAHWRLRAMHELGTIALLARSEVQALVEAQQLAVALGAMATAAVLDIEIAAGYASVDDLEAADRHGEQAVRRGSELGLDLVTAWGWQHVAAVAGLRGEHERAEAARDAALAAAPRDRDIEGFVVGGQLFAALAHDDLDTALELATRMTEILRGSRTAAPAHSRAAWPLLLALAHRPEARAAIDEMERAGVAVTPGGQAWLGLARAVVAGRTDPARAAALAAEADAELVHMPLWRSIGRRLAAEAAAADGWQIPTGWLTEAELTLRGLGYHRAADACRRLRGVEAGDVPGAWAERGITRREAEVLTLVVEGCPNREIAERLYLSVRTVEKHVESLMRKTATKTRTQLARAATIT
jgi:DNA-binding CsgD family transcriptional regulator/tetratricopeptide (TPR) repeat protein